MKIIQYGLMFLLLSQNVFAQDFLRRDEKQIVNGTGQQVILRSMGLGGWMVQEGYMLQTSGFANAQHEIRAKIETLIGSQNTETFYDAWLVNQCRKIDVDSLAAWGFNSIRLPMHYNLYTLPIEDEPQSGQNTWLEKGFELTDSLLSWCSANNMYLILDLHAAPGGQGYESAISDYDPAKPSLWQSAANRAKTVALWRRLAERYAAEPWIGGYDLINETNWNMSNNSMLKQLYLDITAAIREVDNNHIIFIEGNWFANDFTGLTPPWDDNMVYSFHKYWSYNDQSSIQWMLDIRDDHNIPIWCGESGENSSVWFRDAIRLFEENEIGWAWWPLKKVGEIDGPLKIIKNSGYQTLLDYWSGSGGAPSAQNAFNALMEFAENTRFENCEYDKSVIDAMFRQVYTDDTKPFKEHSVPGVIFAADYDLGSNEFAYFERNSLADYHVSTGNFTEWNSGWAYRNDAVDIEACLDTDKTNGYNLGWTKGGEWLNYTVDIDSTGSYDAKFRIASEQATGRFHMEIENRSISGSVNVNSTGGWQNWQNIIVEDVLLEQGQHTLTLCIDQAEFNINYMEFDNYKPVDSVEFKVISAYLIPDVNQIILSFNKPLLGTIGDLKLGFLIQVNDNPVAIEDCITDSTSYQMIFNIQGPVFYQDIAHISYNGNQLMAVDSTRLAAFTDLLIINNLPSRFILPYKIEAENFHFNSGFELESTSDQGGGQNLGYSDAGDYADYFISVENPGTFNVSYRVASQSAAGEILVQLIDSLSIRPIQRISFPVTGDWQSWQTVNGLVNLPAGDYKLRLNVLQAGFNLNWINFDLVNSLTADETLFSDFHLWQNYPNPFNPLTRIKYTLKENSNVQIDVFNALGQKVKTLLNKNQTAGTHEINFDAGELSSGIYFYRLKAGDFTQIRKMILMK